MPIEEREALARAHRPWTRGLWAIALSIVIAGAAFAVVAAAVPGTVEHLLGQSTQRTATVTGIDEADVCTRSSRDVYTLIWQEGATTQSGAVGRCGDPWQVGDRIEIWATSGEPQTSSPLAPRVALAAVAAAFAIAIVAIWRKRAHIRRATASAIDGTWRPLMLPTTGRPGSHAFRVDSAEPVRNKPRDWLLVLHESTGHAPTSATVPGTLFVDAVRKGRPRALSLHTTADGGRVWRWHR